eukprot:12330020-Alexandrium_andersonii.AAC.1
MAGFLGLGFLAVLMRSAQTCRVGEAKVPGPEVAPKLSLCANGGSGLSANADEGAAPSDGDGAVRD